MPGILKVIFITNDSGTKMIPITGALVVGIFYGFGLRRYYRDLANLCRMCPRSYFPSGGWLPRAHLAVSVLSRVHWQQRLRSAGGLGCWLAHWYSELTVLM